MAIEHWLRLTYTDGLGPVLTRRLIEHAGSAEAACDAGTALLRQVEGIGASKAGSIVASLRESTDLARAELDRAAAKQYRLLCPDDAEYPTLLKQISDPPGVLYVRGTLEPRDLNGMAIVGSRRCSIYGREQADRFGSLLAGAGFTVMSGGARGIDTAAHRGAMQCTGGRTFAVLGCGLDIAYPPENESLLRQIAERGAVVSEYPIGTPPLAENFPRRNRIISGVSRGVLVIEADVRSGALITARVAADDHNRPVMALPGRVDNAMSAGPHALIRDGATLVTNLEEILEALGPLSQLAAEAVEPSLFESPSEAVAKPRATVATLSARQETLVGHLSEDPITVDAIVDRSGFEVGVVLQELTFLTLKGVVKRGDGQTYARKR